MDFLENGGVQTQNVISLRLGIGLRQIQVLGIPGGRALQAHGIHLIHQREFNMILKHFSPRRWIFYVLIPHHVMFLFFEILIDPRTKNDLLTSIRNQIKQTTAKNKVLVIYFQKNSRGALYETN